MQEEIKEKPANRVTLRHKCRKNLKEEKYGTAYLSTAVDENYLVGTCNKCGVIVSQRKSENGVL